MGCCGQRRDSFRSSAFPNTSTDRPPSHEVQRESRPSYGKRSPSPPMSSPPVPAESHSVALQYTETSHIVVDGPATRRRYEFSAAHPIQMVDPADVAALLSTRFFKRR